jgi:hypothetical protein
MFRFMLDRRLARKTTNPDEVLDLGAGSRNCIACVYLTGPKEETGYTCARFVDALSSYEMPAGEIRVDESSCGLAASGFDSGQKADWENFITTDEIFADPALVVEHVPSLELPTPRPSDPMPVDAVAGGDCRMCAHSFVAYFEDYVPQPYCARAFNLATMRPHLCEDTRVSESLCGLGAAWWEEAPPMSVEDEALLIQGGHTHYHW